MSLQCKSGCQGKQPLVWRALECFETYRLCPRSGTYNDQKSHRQHNEKGAGYRPERTLMGCSETPTPNSPPTFSSRFSVAKGGFDRTYMDNPIRSIEMRPAALPSALTFVLLPLLLLLLSRFAVKFPYHSINHAMPSYIIWLPKSVWIATSDAGDASRTALIPCDTKCPNCLHPPHHNRPPSPQG